MNMRFTAIIKINFTFTAKYSVIPDFSAVVQENVYNGTYGGQMPMAITLTIVDDTKATLVQRSWRDTPLRLTALMCLRTV